MSVKPTISENNCIHQCKQNDEKNRFEQVAGTIKIKPNKSNQILAYHSDHLVRLGFYLLACIQCIGDVLWKNIVQRRWLSSHLFLISISHPFKWLGFPASHVNEDVVKVRCTRTEKRVGSPTLFHHFRHLWRARRWNFRPFIDPWVTYLG